VDDYDEVDYGNEVPSSDDYDPESEPPETNEEGYKVLSGSLYDCPSPGFYPYESNCREFYVCLEVLPGVLLAEQLYRCPARYLFDEERKRCLREELVNCTKFDLTGSSAQNAKNNNVLVVIERFLNQFFNTPLYYNRNFL